MSFTTFRLQKSTSQIRYTHRYIFHSRSALAELKKIPHRLVHILSRCRVTRIFHRCSHRTIDCEKKRKSGIHTSSIIVVRFKSRWCIFRELIRAANVCDWCAPVIWILTGWPTYTSASKLSQSVGRNLSGEVSRWKSAAKKEGGRGGGEKSRNNTVERRWD